MTRDDAVRVVAEAYARDVWHYPVDSAEALIARGFGAHVAHTAVAALVAAGWGDLAAERERLAVAVEALDSLTVTGGSASAGYAVCRSHAARLIRTTTEEAQP